MNYFSLKVGGDFIHFGCKTKEMAMSWFRAFLMYTHYHTLNSNFAKTTESNNLTKESNEIKNSFIKSNIKQERVSSFSPIDPLMQTTYNIGNINTIHSNQTKTFHAPKYQVINSQNIHPNMTINLTQVTKCVSFILFRKFIIKEM